MCSLDGLSLVFNCKPVYSFFPKQKTLPRSLEMISRPSAMAGEAVNRSAQISFPVQCSIFGVECNQFAPVGSKENTSAGDRRRRINHRFGLVFPNPMTVLQVDGVNTLAACTENHRFVFRDLGNRR